MGPRNPPAPSALKSALKEINDLIKQQKYEEAIEKAREVLGKDDKIFQANVFIAFASDCLGRYGEAEAAYLAAANLRPDDPQPWQGLVRLYEKQDAPKLRDAVVHLAHLFVAKEDLYRAQDTVDKFIGHVRSREGNNNTPRLIDAMTILLPDGPLYRILEGRLPHPARTLETLVGMIEEQDKKQINMLIGERRTRLGARLVDVTADAMREVYGRSMFDRILRMAISWTSDDDVRRGYEEKLVRHYVELTRIAVPGPQKEAARTELQSLAEGMVVIRHPFQPAWDIAVDWKDCAEISGWDAAVLRSYRELFPESGLAKILTGFLASPVSPFPPEPEAAAGQEQEHPDETADLAAANVTPLTEVDRLVMMIEGAAGTDSLLAHRLLGEYYRYLEEYDSAVELMRGALALLDRKRAETGLAFRETENAFSLYLATALVFHQSPRHHSESKNLFDGILERRPDATAALIGIGLIYEEEEDYDRAIGFFDRALLRDGENARIRVEAAWVSALRGELDVALDHLGRCQAFLAAAGDGRPNDLGARVHYITGYCLWHADPTRAARKNRKGAYAHFVQAIKSDLGFAPAYTSLGVYFADYAHDRKRACRSFQKAVELSPNEVVAAERLARHFADEGDWERVELVARRVVDSGRVRPPPGSKRKGLGWPFAALGVAGLNGQDFEKAIASFQAALRIAPADYHSWVGLAECYHASGRYVAATRTILSAQALREQGLPAVPVSPDDAWFATYLLANVKRELGDHDEAVELYRTVIRNRPDERGVALALLRTMIESALCGIENGYYGKGVQLALETIEYAAADSGRRLSDDFNYWKAVADACAVFTLVQSRAGDFPAEAVQQILQHPSAAATGGGDCYAVLSDTDLVGPEVVFASGKFPPDEESGVELTRCVHASLLAYKRAVHVCSRDAHAQSTAYYNLGWAEYRAHSCLPAPLREKHNRHARAAVRAFKRAIELEAGNAEFWNALGVVTSRTNPAVAQHAFVRSLVLDERSAVAWTNLGALALLQSDLQIAHQAFTKAQAVDPGYAHAWVGQSHVALLCGRPGEWRRLLAHAVKISDSSSLATRRLYPFAVFDHVSSAAARTEDAAADSVVEALFALAQLRALRPEDHAGRHLAGLLYERGGNYGRMADVLEHICDEAEVDFEATESADALIRFVLGKADLARAYLAAGRHDDAVAAADTALGLSSDEADNELSAAQRHRARLSANVTVGIAQYHQGEVDEAVLSFRAALEEAGGDDDAAFLLAQALWATGDPDYADKARELLEELAGEDPAHVQGTLLLSVVALLSGDERGMRAARARLHALRVVASVPLTAAEDASAAAILRAFAQRCGDGQAVLARAQADVMLAPDRPHGWSEIAGLGRSPEAAETALRVAESLVHGAKAGTGTDGGEAIEELATALAGTGRVGDAQRGVVTAPWLVEGWAALDAAARG